MHGDDEIIEKETERISNQIDNIKADVIDEVMTELIGRSPYLFKYYWGDETKTLRGYGGFRGALPPTGQRAEVQSV